MLMLLSISFLILLFTGANTPEPLLNEYLREGDASSLLNYFVTKNVLLEEKPFYGSGQISMIVVVDFYSLDSKEFYSKMQSVYSDEKLYHKYFMTKEEYESKTGRYLFAIASECNIQEGKNIFEYNLRLHDLGITGKNADVIPDDCIINSNSIYYDMIESETYRIIAPSLQISIEGQNNENIIGNQDFDKIQKALINTKIRIGQ